MAILAQAILLKSFVARACRQVLCFCTSVRRGRRMPRRGWLPSEQGNQTAHFIERAKKRLTSAGSGSSGLKIGDWSVPKSCTKPNCVWKGSVQKPRNRWQLPSPPPAPPDWGSEVMRLRQQVVELLCQRPLHSRVQASHPMQSSVEAAQLVEERASKRRAWCLPSKHLQSSCVRNIWNSGMRWRSGIHQW